MPCFMPNAAPITRLNGRDQAKFEPPLCSALAVVMMVIIETEKGARAECRKMYL